MADSVVYKDVKSLEKFDGELRYQLNARDEVSIKESDALGGVWRPVREGDTIKRVDGGFVVVRKSDK